MKIAYKLIILAIVFILGLGGNCITAYATENNTEVDAVTEAIDEITTTVVEEGLDNVEDILESALDKLEESKLEITDEQKLKIIESILEKSGKEYNMEEIEQQIKDIEQTVSDITEAFRIVKELFIKVADTIKQIWNAFTSWFTEFQQTEEYEEIVNGIDDIKHTLESAANEMENKSTETYK